ncbi:MAG: hypothetical protein WCY97_11270 [Methanothrix sp.]|jgi:hypothetical protein|uniref:Uncharacterized protein n=1 Tax=Methanothrix harundinacea TaxID=301375 RepID=A0A101FV59_9EURY|nr:MAG: hypothetical protein APR56_14425 [Methanosaeta sp. SDB]KUK45091.1 MAG: Uncharacterized protein XD72_0495 [Methanothrix harundinacea]MDD3709361.1 hypothetical protein [Methanothrix sp.]MDI9398518.1 hypothetical protein [Euryarchaeota archaeon]KUK97432.1 MAG: Uncharacterized protein XE07_0262 [Methanothrix harundinacea]
MARKLSDKDVEILKKLAPECADITCSGSGFDYQSILPPVSNHYALDDDDFEERLNQLDIFELKYLSEVILDGSESLGCIQPEHADILVRLLKERLSEDVGEKVRVLYEAAGVCYY